MFRTPTLFTIVLLSCSEARIVSEDDADVVPTETTTDVVVDADEPCDASLEGETRCGPSDREQCSAGTWRASPCESGTACDLGACEPVICEPGASACQDTRTRTECNASGTRLLRELCTFGLCTDDACVTSCVPGTRRCDGMDVLACDDDGVESLAFTCEGQRGEACAAGRCLSECELEGGKRGYMACDFWAADLPNDSTAIDNVFAFAFSNASGRVATVTITYPWGPIETLDVPVGGIATHALPVPRILSQILEPGVGRYGFRIQSSAPIAAWMFNPLERYDASDETTVATNDASLLIPATSLGTNYLAVTWSDQGQFSRPPYVTVVATQNATEVVVRTTTTVTMAQSPFIARAGEATRVVLNAHETLNLEPPGAPGVRRDLTGTSVVSLNHPIAVFSGNRCARVPDEGRFCDHIETQLPPVETWGDRFVVTKFTDRGGESDYFRVLATEGDTQLVFDPPRAAPILVAGGMWQFESKGDFVLTTSKPVLLAQFMASQNMTRPPGPFGVSGDCPSEIGGTCQGDPALVLAAPIAQWRRELIFLVPDTYRHQFINIATSAGTEITLDGVPLDMSAAKAIGDSEWQSLVVPVVGGYHKLIASQPVGVVVYGYDHNISYAYNAGLDFKALTAR